MTHLKERVYEQLDVVQRWIISFEVFVKLQLTHNSMIFEPDFSFQLEPKCINEPNTESDSPYMKNLPKDEKHPMRFSL